MKNLETLGKTGTVGRYGFQAKFGHFCSNNKQNEAWKTRCQVSTSCNRSFLPKTADRLDHPLGIRQKRAKTFSNRIVCMRLTKRKYYCCKIIMITLASNLIIPDITNPSSNYCWFSVSRHPK